MRRSKKRIDQALEPLELHVFDSNLKISHLSKRCNFSDVTFRHTFSARFGTSPQKHMIAQRLKRAKAILESGEYKNITEIARTVGYEDPLYFSRYFRTFYGSSPSHFS